jgi:hypothetical protein
MTCQCTDLKREPDVIRTGRPEVIERLVVSRAGLEPATTALKVRCSTN